MNNYLREISVGRDKSCDIYLDESCQAASRQHGSIYIDGGQLMYRDHSTNGTFINNVKVHQRAVPIRPGDIIMAAGRYQIGWPQILRHFPQAQAPAQQGYGQQGYGQTYAQPAYTPAPDPYVPAQAAAPTDQELRKWNWGAFALYPIWGFFNGCPWAILFILLGGTLLPSIFFGVFGTRWAWQNGHWGSVEEFLQTQKEWSKWGIILSIVGLVVFVLCILMWIPLLFAAARW